VLATQLLHVWGVNMQQKHVVVAPEMCTLIRKREAAMLLHLNRPYQLQQLGSHAIKEATLVCQPCTCSMEVSGRLATPVVLRHMLGYVA
jgi:hypothetical protein